MILPFRNKTPVIPDSCYVSDSVDIIGDVILGEETNVWFGAVIRGDMNYIRIGNRTNIQDNCTIHVTTDVSPTIIGDEVTVGHNAMIHGCTIEDRCLIGMGAILLDDSVVGKGSIVGAGALVPPKMIIPPRSLCLGIPARIVRNVTDKEFQENIDSAQHYIDFANLYKIQ
ncbi:MAG: gamma carbonic anhydrase family protein [Candidatus Marinimicrobia bacterium]|nr:gamma carbonic anhydrase family protein [Candidatus Neomarinimicrobiota bacterium]